MLLADVLGVDDAGQQYDPGAAHDGTEGEGPTEGDVAPGHLLLITALTIC
jgi:hypothetical protein